MFLLHSEMIQKLFVFCLSGALLVIAEDHDCFLSKDPGQACKEEKTERFFYYDSRMSICQPFSYLGCSGNSNRFKTFKECMNTCKNAQPSPKQTVKTGHAQWVHADKCGAAYLIPDGEYTKCRADRRRSTCPEHHKCTNGVCCPSREYVCSRQDDSGTFADGIEDKPRFAWSEEIQSCLRFSYYGAGGNYNSFQSFQDCIKFCTAHKMS